jgi:hypothetical protein
LSALLTELLRQGSDTLNYFLFCSTTGTKLPVTILLYLLNPYDGTCGDRREAIRRRRPQDPSRVLFLSPATPPVRPTSDGGLGGMADHGLSPVGGFLFLFRLFFGVFFVEMLKWWLHLEVRIRSSPPYPCSVGASCAGGGRVESCARRIS